MTVFTVFHISNGLTFFFFFVALTRVITFNNEMVLFVAQEHAISMLQEQQQHFLELFRVISGEAVCTEGYLYLSIHAEDGTKYILQNQLFT